MRWVIMGLGFMFSSLVRAESSHQSGALSWECEARPALGTPVYIGQGGSQLDAKEAADQKCRADGHLICYVDDCEADPGAPVRTTVSVKGITYYLGYEPRLSAHPARIHPTATALPLTYDAVAAGAATPVKGDGQGSCGDCWAWARTSSLEAAAIAAGNPVSLSEEDTTDNASDEDGCGGGSMDFNYELSHGVTSLALCPWEGGGGSCDAAPAAKGVSMAYVGGDSGPTDAELMAAIYQYGSVAVTVAAGDEFDVDPGTDRMTDCDGQGIDHMVSLVGFRPSPSGGVEYKMKNSWGSSWGASGYAYLAIGCNQIATGDQSAMVIWASSTPVPPPVPPAPTVWQCTAYPALGSSSYTGQGATQATAEDAAEQSCRSAGHLICRAKDCTQVR
jgi:hypothetical protein